MSNLIFDINFLSFAFLLTLSNCWCTINPYGHYKSHNPWGECGEPLFLTPLIHANKIEEAKVAAKVRSFISDANVVSYSGYFTVNEKYKSNLFAWFFPSEFNYESSPVVLWLQGGPGTSSLFGLFAENGPYFIETIHVIGLRNYTWTKTVSMLYIDNPVGTGYSFSDDDGYARNEQDVANNLYEALIQFFTMFPELQKNGFFITGESYAGKYIPALAYAIHNKNPNAQLKINLEGLAIGNGFCDPRHMLQYGDYLYQIGLLDKHGKELFTEKEKHALLHIGMKQWVKAYNVFDLLLNTDTHGPSYFFNLTGIKNYYNYVQDYDSTVMSSINDFVQDSVVRKFIHVGNQTFSTDMKVENYLKADIMQSVLQWIEVLIEKYRILIYNGQLDIIVPYRLTLEFLEKIRWTGATEYASAPRRIWKVDGLVGGYSKTVKNFTELLVRNAGLMVPADQPKFGFDIINRLAYHKPF